MTLENISLCENGNIMVCDDGNIALCDDLAPCTCPCTSWPGAYPWDPNDEPCNGLLDEYTATMTSPIRVILTRNGNDTEFKWDASLCVALAFSIGTCRWNVVTSGYTRYYIDESLQQDNPNTGASIAIVQAGTSYGLSYPCRWSCQMGQNDGMLETPIMFKSFGDTPAGTYPGPGNILSWGGFTVGVDGVTQIQLLGTILVTEAT